jgi:hypothetical protein
MRFKRFLPRILLLFGFLLLLLVIKYPTEIQSLSKDIIFLNFERLKIYFSNFFYYAGSQPKRNPPLSLLTKETELRLYIGEPFKSFSQKDWDKFWNLIYGAFPKEAPERQGLPKRLRQLTQDEIIYELSSRYPQQFANFRKEHWEIFFGILFKR